MRDDEITYKDPRKEDIVYGDRRISRPDLSLPDWEVPDGVYRPVPIVWCTGALFAQIIVLSVLMVILSDQNGLLTVALYAAATLGIGIWTWQRGMGDAGLGWKAATVIMLASWFAIYSMGAVTRL